MNLSSQKLNEFLFCEFALTCAPVSEGVYESQLFVQEGVAHGRSGHSLIQWGKRNTSLLSFRIRPDWNGLVARYNQSVQWIGGIGGGKTTGWFSALRRKRILDTMNEEFFKRRQIRTIEHFRAVQEMSGLEALHSGMDLR